MPTPCPVCVDTFLDWDCIELEKSIRPISLPRRILGAAPFLLGLHRWPLALAYSVLNPAPLTAPVPATVHAAVYVRYMDNSGQ